MQAIFFTAFFLFSSFFCLQADNWKKSYSTDYFAGPEIYHVTRTRAGGSKQTGTVYGVRIGMDRVSRYKFYWGTDFLWATGSLKGDVHEQKLSSDLTDTNLEARFGYTLGCKSWRCATLTPYVGLGFFVEKNNYKDPSPLSVHFKNKFGYIPLGFLSQVFLTENISIGLNFKIRFLFEQQIHVTHDPSAKNHIQHYNEKLQYRVDLPLSYFSDCFCRNFSVSAVPFYEYRSYGYRINFPCDFFETKFNLYGVTLKIALIF